MKKFISLFLVASMILGNFSSGMVHAVSNYVDITESISEELNIDEDVSNSEEDENIDLEQEDDSLNEDSDETESTENKDVDIENSSTEAIVDMPSTYAINYPITFIYNNIPIKVDRLAVALAHINNSNNTTGTITIRFDYDYTITPEDVTFMKIAFKNERLIFTAKPGVTVTIEHDLELYMNESNYQPSYNSAKTITFENIRLKFTDEHAIYANGIWLHMGENVEMVGPHYPKLFAGTKSSGNDINDTVKMYIQSGTYSEVAFHSESNGRRMNRPGELYIYSGYIQRIFSEKNDKHQSNVNVKIYSGTVDEVVKYDNVTNVTSSISLEVAGKTTIKNIKDASNVTVGIKESPPPDFKPKFTPGHLVITDSMKIDGSIGIYENCTFEIAGSVANTVEAGGIWYDLGATLCLPANRDDQNIPLALNSGSGFNQYTPSINLKLSTKPSRRDFSLVKVNNYYGDVQTGRDKYIVDENEYFYLAQHEEKFDSTSNISYVYLKGTAKEKGPLIYNTTDDKFYYENWDGNEEEAHWINNKIANKTINLNDLNYEALATENNYYVLWPIAVTLKIRGTGSGRTLKFDNNRHSDRPINVEFENLNAVDSEFVLKNINSITVKGHNSIEQTSNNKTALTYSFAGSNRDALSLATDDSSFVVYDKSSNSDKYNIRDNIVDDGNTSNAAIVKMSFEDSISANNAKSFKLEPINSNSNSNLKPRKFSTKVGYDKLTLLLPGDNNDYLLKEDNSSTSNIPYYYQSTGTVNGGNSGKIETKFTLTTNSKKDYYKVNSKSRVHVIATKPGNQKVYYLSDKLKETMENYIDHTGSTHEVVFLGNYEITSEDVTAMKGYSKKTNGITFKTKTDGWMYVLNVDRDIELVKDVHGNLFTVTFDDIKFNYKSSDKWIYANGRGLRFGDNVEMQGNNYPSVSAGQKSAPQNDRVNNANITINSGTYKDVTGDRYNSVQNTTITINGGRFKGKVSGLDAKSSSTTSSATDRINNAALIIKGGTFESDVYGITTGSNANGTLTMTIDEGTFKTNVIAVDGRIGENSTLTINNGTFESHVYGTRSSSNVEKKLDITINNGTFRESFIGLNGGIVNNATLIVNNGDFNTVLHGASLNTTGGSATTLNGNLDITITNGIFRNQVQGANSGLSRGNINMNISGGTFKHNVVGTETKVDNLVMTISGGNFEQAVAGNNINTEQLKTNRIELNISEGTFNWDVYGAVRADNVTMNISGGTFITQVANYHVNNVTMNISQGEFNGVITGSKIQNQSNINVTMNITNGDFKNIIYGSVGAGTTNINVSGGKFNRKLVGNENTNTNNVTININDNVTIPRITHYDKLVVGDARKAVLEITEGIDIAQNKKTELVIKRESKVKLQGNIQNTVNKLTIEGTGNILELNIDAGTIPLVVKEGYTTTNNNKLKLELVGALANNKEIIKFESLNANANVSNFEFVHADYFIREAKNQNSTIITLTQKVTPTKLIFRLELNTSKLKYSTDGTNFDDVWWYTDDLRDRDIEFTADNLLKYQGMELFKNVNTLTAGNKVFEITNAANDKNISFDLGQSLNFDVKLTDVNLTDSRLELKNLRDLEISGSNSISERAADTEPAFSYGISGQVKTANDASKLIVYSDNSNDGIKVLGSKQGYGVKIIFDEPFTSQKSINLKNINNNNINIALDMKNNYQKVSLLLSQSYANGRYNLIDTSNQNQVYYSEESGTNNITYDIAMDNSGKTYNVSNKPFIEIKEGNNFVAIKKNMADVITCINSDSNKNSKDYTLTFINNYTLDSTDLSNWKSWGSSVRSLTITTNYAPLSKKYELKIDGDLVLPKLKYTTTFEDVKLRFTNSNTWIYANSGRLVFGNNVEMEGQNYPSVSAGGPSGTAINNIDYAELTINSGTFNEVTGDRYNSLQNTTVTINGGTFNGKVSGLDAKSSSTTSNATDRVNNVTLIIHNGTFKSDVYGISTGSNANGKLDMTIHDGTFDRTVVAVDGRVKNNSTLTIHRGEFKSYVYGTRSTSNLENNLDITIHNGTFNRSVVVLNGGEIRNATLLVNNGNFKEYVFGASTANNTLGCSSGGSPTNLRENLGITIKNGTFENQVQGANSGLSRGNITMNISGGTFKHNVVGTETKIDNLVMTISGGNFERQTVGNYTLNPNNSTERITLNISGGTFTDKVYGAMYADDIIINVSGGTFNTALEGIDHSRKNKVIININGDVTIPKIYHYDELVVGSSTKSTLTITNVLEAVGRVNDELIIKNGSEVKLQGNKQHAVNKLTIDGSGNILTLNVDANSIPLVVKTNYNNNSQKLKLNLTGTKANNKELIKFLNFNVDVNNFEFVDADYYIREIGNGSQKTITLYEKMAPNKLEFKLDLNDSKLKYSTDGSTFHDVWWYTPSLATTTINFNEGNLFKYKNMNIFKDVNTIPNGKVFEITNTGSNKIISVDLGQGSNFDFKLNNAKLNTSKLDVKNINNLIISGTNSILGISSNVDPVFSYNISGQVQTIGNNPKLVVYGNRNNTGISATGNKGYGAIFEFKDSFSQETTLNLKETNNGNNNIQLVIPTGYEKVSLLLPQALSGKTYNLVDNTNQNSKYYSGAITDSTFKYDISISNVSNTINTYSNVSNKPFIGISKNGAYVESKNNMSDVINYIKSNNDKATTDYTLTFIHDYVLDSKDLSDWQSWTDIVKSLTLTTKYTPLNKTYLLTVDNDLTLSNAGYETKFKDISLKFKNNTNPWIYANGNTLVMESGITIDSNNNLSISGGNNSRSSISSVDIKVLDGTYKSIVGSNNSSVTGDISVTIGGTATVSNSIVGSKQSANNKKIILNKDLTVDEITDFDELIVGNTKKVALSQFNKLDKESSQGDLILKNGSKVSFKSGLQKSQLGDIEVDGANNILELPSNKNTAQLELSGTIKLDNNNNKLNIELSGLSNNATANETYLIKFDNVANADVENKYNLPSGYYVRDIGNTNSGYAVLYPQTTFDLEYNFNDKKLYKLENNVKSEAWWYTGGSNNVTLNTDTLFKYKGYDLFKTSNNTTDRKITLKGTNSNQTVVIEDKLDNLNVILDGIDLTNSTVELKNIKSLKLEGENTINHINAMNQNQAIFTYSFNNAKAGDKVLADNDDSYLKIFTNKTTNPFSGNVGTAIDFKFFKPFKSNSPSTTSTKVRLVDDAKHELKFDIPDDTQRLGILLGNSNNNKTYNLYHGNSGTTGTSVYVAGNTDQTFRESFDTQSNSIQVYDYVRRANPVNKIDIDAPANIGFNVTVPADQLDVVKPNNWNQYFVATDLEVKNDSLRIKDQFTDEHGVTHHFGETNSDLELGYLGVSASNTGNNSIELVSNTQLDPNIISSDPGVKLALKLSDGTDSIPLNERDAQNNPLKTWIIQPNALEKLTIEPNFDSNDNFFNVNLSLPKVVTSTHNFTFRFNVKTP